MKKRKKKSRFIKTHQIIEEFAEIHQRDELRTLYAECRDCIAHETPKLLHGLYMVNELMAYGDTLHSDTTIGSTMKTLNDKTMFEELVYETNPRSVFYKDPPLFYSLRECLAYCLAHEIVLESDTLFETAETLSRRLRSNKEVSPEKREFSQKL